MIQFMDDVAMNGYEKLLETSESYQQDVGNLNQMMEEFACESEQLKANMEVANQLNLEVNKFKLE